MAIGMRDEVRVLEGRGLPGEGPGPSVPLSSVSPALMGSQSRDGTRPFTSRAEKESMVMDAEQSHGPEPGTGQH